MPLIKIRNNWICIDPKNLIVCIERTIRYHYIRKIVSTYFKCLKFKTKKTTNKKKVFNYRFLKFPKASSGSS